MRSIIVGLCLGVTLLGVVAGLDASQTVAVADTRIARADTIPKPWGLERLQPGVPIRAAYAPYGDSLRPVTELTGTFVELEVGEAFEMHVVDGDRVLLRQVAIEDLISIEVGSVRRATTRGGIMGGLGGALLGIAGAAIGASGTSDDAEYAAGAAIGGLLGAGVGSLLGYRSTEIVWRRLPMYGPVYGDIPPEHD